MMLMHRQTASLAKAQLSCSRRSAVVVQARLATRRRGVTLQRLEGGSSSVAVQEPVYADSFAPTTSNRRPASARRISDSVVVPSRTFPALISFPSITQQDAGQMASIIKHELLSHSEALIVVNGSEALMTAMESMCTTNNLLINEGRNMQVSIKPRSLGEEGYMEGNFVLEASLSSSSFPAVGAHLDAPARFNPRRANGLVSEILAHPSVLMTCMGESAIESALMTLALARARLESEEPGSDLTVMVKPFGAEVGSAATGYALYISRSSPRTPAPSSLPRSTPAAAPRARAPSPTRRGGMAWRLAQESSSSAPAAAASYSAPAAASSRPASPARKGTAWRLAQMSDSAAPAPASTRATSSNERDQRSVTPTRRRGGIAARFGADEPAAPATPSYSAPAPTSSASSSSRAASRGRVRRGGMAARFASDDSHVAEEPVVQRRAAAREASPTRRRGGIAARLGM